MKKSVNVFGSDNCKFIRIYELRCRKHNGEVITSDRFLNKEDAEKAKDIIYEALTDLYISAWIMEEFVWI